MPSAGANHAISSTRRCADCASAANTATVPRSALRAVANSAIASASAEPASGGGARRCPGPGASGVRRGKSSGYAAGCAAGVGVEAGGNGTDVAPASAAVATRVVDIGCEEVRTAHDYTRAPCTPA